MANRFVDRQPTLPNRYKITPADGMEYYATLERADEPTVLGTPLNAETLNKLYSPDNKPTLAEIGAAPAGLVSTTIYPKTYAAFMEELRSIYTDMPNTQNTPKKFVYAGIETGGDTANGELGGGAWFVEINRGSENYGTIKASNDYYGDRRLDIYGTWGKWVDVSPKAFTPASHAADKNNPHGVTIAQIGAAPAGCGLGDIAVRKTVTEANVSGFFATDDTPDSLWAWGTRAKFSDDYTIEEVTYAAGRKMQRVWTKGVPGEWEYFNPPMRPGVEYRTTERCNGYVVYAKRVQFSNSSNIAADNSVVDTKIPHGISNFSELVRCSCWKSGYLLPYLKDNGGFTAIAQVEVTDITLRVFKANWSPSTWNIDLYYVKS